MDNQGIFFKNLRTSLGLPPAQDRGRTSFARLFPSRDYGTLPQQIAGRSEEDLEELLRILVENGAGLKLEVEIVDTMADAADAVVNVIRDSSPEFQHVKHVMQHDHPDVAALQLWKRFTHEAVTLHTSYLADDSTREKILASFVGITAPVLGVADSATLVELCEPGRPRSTSLVPSIHVAILRRENLVANLEEAYYRISQLRNARPGKKQPPMVFISGPSKTADIEAHLVHGAHGPCRVVLVVVREGAENQA